MSTNSELDAQLDTAPLFRGVFLIAAATLLLEVGLIRVLSFTIWHHFAYVVISTALLGFGTSGTFLAVRSGFGTANLRGTLVSCSLLAAGSTVGLLLLMALLPLHPMSLFSDPVQPFLFVLYQVATAVPFFFSGLVIALALRHAALRVDRLYFWDLVGAGLGCALAVPAMHAVTPPGAVLIAASIFAAGAAGFAAPGTRRNQALALTVLLLIAAPLGDRLPFAPTNSKELAIQIHTLGFQPFFARWTALFRTDVAEDRTAATRRQPLAGTSPERPGGQRPQFYISHDATAGTGIYNLVPDHRIDYLENSVLRVPYLVFENAPTVLVIGVGGGRDMIAAKQFGAARVVGVELDPIAVNLMKGQFDELSKGFFNLPQVELNVGEGRHFVRSTGDRFDLIQLTGVDTLAAEASGSHVLSENVLYTVEAMHDYLNVLNPGGVVSFAMGNLNSNEPRAAGRIVSIAQHALRERGITEVDRHVIVVDSRNLYTEVMISNAPFTPRQIEAVTRVAKDLRFPILLAPGHDGHPVFQGLLTKTGPERDQFLRDLKYDVSLITDDRPFFFHFFRWGSLLEPGTLTPSHTSALGQLVLVFLVISLTVLGGFFVLVPLVVFRRKGLVSSGGEAAGLLVYFTAIGLGFMLFEISLIQRFVLFLGYPTYSLTVTLCSLLIWLGCGSYVSRLWVDREEIVLPLAVFAIAGLTFAYMYGLPVLQEVFANSHILIRCMVTALVLMPLGLVLGSFFPLGIRFANDIHEDCVPWGWGINGCASVVAGVLTVVLAITIGFSRVWMLSTVVYGVGVAALLLTRRHRAQGSRDAAAISADGAS